LVFVMVCLLPLVVCEIDSMDVKLILDRDNHRLYNYVFVLAKEVSHTFVGLD
jgi:hypothetical protein